MPVGRNSKEEESLLLFLPKFPYLPSLAFACKVRGEKAEQGPEVGEHHVGVPLLIFFSAADLSVTALPKHVPFPVTGIAVPDPHPSFWPTAAIGLGSLGRPSL